jgi:hypothetical protein
MIADQPYVRQLAAPAGAVGAFALLQADAALLGHAGPELGSLRVTRPDGSAVAYRVRPAAPPQRALAAQRRSGGLTANGAVAEFDLGRARSHAALGLQLRLRADTPVGRVRVFGSPDRRTWARFARGLVYRLEGDGTIPAHSARIVYAPVDYRYLRVEVAGAASIEGASATLASPASARPPAPVALPPVRSSTAATAGTTRVTLRLLGRPTVTSLRIDTSAARLDRPFLVEQPAPGGGWIAVASGELRRTAPGGALVVRGLGAGGGSLRLRILDGADAPLPQLRVRAFADGRSLVLDHPGAGPLTLRYGAALAAPSYEFARLPLRDDGRLVAWRLRPETRLAATPPARSLWHRHTWLGSALFVALTAVIAVAGWRVVARSRGAA